LIINKSEVLCKTARVIQLEVASRQFVGGHKESFMISRSGFEPWTFRFKGMSATYWNAKLCSRLCN